MERPSAVELSHYTDYRRYLRDVYDFKRKTESSVTRSYTYAVFAAAADIKSPNYLKLVIEGDRNLSDTMALKFSKALGLTKAQTDEFCLLVKYGQSDDPSERNSFLRKLSECRLKLKMLNGDIEPRLWESIQGWIPWTILHMIDQKYVSFTTEDIQRALGSKASAERILRSMEGLLRSGFIEKDPETGVVKKTRQFFEASTQVPVDLVRKIQSELTLLGLEALHSETPQERESGALTLSLTYEEFEKLKFELRHFRKRLQREFAAKRELTRGDGMFQLIVHLFALTGHAKNGERR